MAGADVAATVPPALVAPSWLGPIDDPTADSATAILVAAAQLFTERSPREVSLREIAARAGANYGLIHHYYGTKDAILAELLRRASAAGAQSMAGSETLDQALDALIDPGSQGTHARMLAHTLLDGADPERLVAVSPAISFLSAMIAREIEAHGGDVNETDPKILAAVLVSTFMGWQVFRPFIRIAAGLDDRDDAAVTADVLTMMRALVVGAVTGGRPLR